MERVLVDSHSEVIPELKILKEKGIIEGKTVCLRHFRSRRLDVLLETGTDRDKNSIVYEDPTDFQGPRGFTGSDEITYVRVIDLTTDPLLSVPVGRNPSLLVDNMDYLERLSPDFGQAVYDSEKLARVSENEFWFQGDPKEALLAIIEIKKK